jgi:tRNA pseudouridine55 synthase
VSANPTSELHGVLVVDKEGGPTSHDVVGHARRALGTRAIGHTGTLDPMATGVLVLLLGEATKLAGYLMANEKTYSTTLRLGVATDTLDAEGQVTEHRPVPRLDHAQVQAIAEGFLGEIDQVAPLASAIKVAGQVLHRALRKGKDIAAPIRHVRLDAIEVTNLRDSEIDFSLRCGKGFYVRSLGRDIAEKLGTVGHLAALRRDRNGVFGVEQAVPFRMLREARDNRELAAELRRRVLPIERALEGFAQVTLSHDGVREARHGKPISLSNVLAQRIGCEDIVVASDEAGTPIALVRREADALRVARGFRATESK